MAFEASIDRDRESCDTHLVQKKCFYILVILSEVLSATNEIK